MKKTNSKFIKITAALLCAVLISTVFSSCGKSDGSLSSEISTDQTNDPGKPLYTERDDKYTKHETVFTILKNNGEVQSTTVTDRLQADKGGILIKDITDLKDVKNLKTGALPIYENEDMLWSSETSDLYYSGTSEKPLPINFSIKYFINDKEIPVNELAGKTGQLKIQIKMINNIYKDININGKSAKIYNPMLTIGGLVFSNTNYKNIKCENGKITDDGTKHIVVFAGMPGLNETLGLENSSIIKNNKLNFNDNFEITADVTDLILGNIYFAAVPLSSITGSETNENKNINNIKDNLDKLKSIEKSIEKMNLSDVLSTIMNNSSNASDLAENISKAASLYKDNKKLLDVFQKYITDDNIKALQAAAETLSSPEAQSFLTLLQDENVQKFIRLLPSASQSIANAAPLAEKLGKDLNDPEIQRELNNLPDTVNKIKQLEASLNSNKELLDAMSELTSKNNAQNVSALLSQISSLNLHLNFSDIVSITNDSDDIVKRFNEMTEYSKEYKIYTKVLDQTPTKLSFIYKTPTIEKPEKIKKSKNTNKKNLMSQIFKKK
ncbi:MAG: hypothetical protein ACTTIO_04065 [Candidatus Fimenecus sp.]